MSVAHAEPCFVDPHDAPLVPRLGILTWSALTASEAEIEARRRAPHLPAGVSLPASFFKHSDPQTILGYAAVAQAVEQAGLPLETYRQWSVVGATKFVGRTVGFGLMTRFLEVGSSASSVHIISQLSLHSLSAAISVAFGMQGANWGAGGGPAAASEALLAAASSFDPSFMPGLWVVMTEWQPEPIPGMDGRNTINSSCHALALALTEPQAGQTCLEIQSEQASRPGFPFSLVDFSTALTAPGEQTWDLGQHFALNLCRA